MQTVYEHFAGLMWDHVRLLRSDNKDRCIYVNRSMAHTLRMLPEINPETLLCTACIIFVVFYLLSGFVNLVTLTLTMPVYIFFSKHDANRTDNPHNPIVSFVVEVMVHVIESVSSFVVVIAMIVVRSAYLLLPVLVFIVLMSLLNANLDTAMPIIVMAYNKFVVETDLILLVRQLAWIGKITFEIFTPLYNWGLESIYTSGMDILKLLVQNKNHQSQFSTIVREIGSLFITLTRTVVSWMVVNFNECKYEAVVADLVALQQISSRTGLQHRCFDFDYLDLDLAPVVMVSQKIATSMHTLSTGLCPSLSSVSALLLYPFYDRHIGKITQNAINMVLGFYYTGQVTQMRCRSAFALSLSSTLCVPDVYPMFRYIERIVESMGLMVDNWLNIAHMMLLSFFMDRDASVVDRCSANGHTVSSLLSESVFEDRPTRLLSCTSSLLAVTDGSTAIYMNKNNNVEPTLVANAFRTPIDVTNGLAAVDFASSLLETDENGDSRTGILGCNCVDGARGEGVSIMCSVALFPAFFDPEHQLQVAETQIPLLFERGTTGQLLTCRYLRISVQSIRFPAQVFDVSKQSSTGSASYNHDIYSECMADPRKCNVVDAAVYVMPLCPKYAEFQEKDASAEPTECIRDSKYQTCFPYCVALHQKGAGNTPMTLHNKRSLAGGVYMANTRVSMPTMASTKTSGENMQTARMRTCLVASEFSRIEDLTPTYCTTQAASSVGVASFSRSESTVQLPVATCTSSDAACADDPSGGTTMSWMQRATVLADSQPYLFAGDIALVQHCELHKTTCHWTTSVHRITSDIHAQYSIINKMSKIPSIRSSDAGVQSEHGGVILPGESNDVVSKRNPAAQTRTGIVYGVNPNPLPFRCLLRSRVLWYTGQPCTEIACTSCYQKPQVFFTQPMYKCSADQSNTVRDVNAQNVRVCHYNTTTEIRFEKNDRFWSTDDTYSEINSGAAINLYIEDIVYVNDLNVVISVRRGPVEEFMWLVGLNDTAWPADKPTKSRTIHYFLNMETLQIRVDAQWTHSTSDISNGQYSILCQTDTMVPIVGSFVASGVVGMCLVGSCISLHRTAWLVASGLRTIVLTCGVFGVQLV